MFDRTISSDPDPHPELAQQRLIDLLWYAAASLAAFGLILGATIATIAALDRVGIYVTVSDYLTVSDKDGLMLD